MAETTEVLPDDIVLVPRQGMAWHIQRHWTPYNTPRKWKRAEAEAKGYYPCSICADGGFARRGKRTGRWLWAEDVIPDRLLYDDPPDTT